MITVQGRDLEDRRSCWLVFFDLSCKLTAFKPRSLIVHINHLDTQHLSGGMLGYPMILSNNSEIVALLLFTIQRFQDGKRAYQKKHISAVCCVRSSQNDLGVRCKDGVTDTVL